MAKTKKKTTKASKTIVPLRATTSQKPTAKESALDRAIAQIEKQYGSGSIMKMDDSVQRHIEHPCHKLLPVVRYFRK